MVSILEGQLTRTWHYVKQDQIHVVSLYHDPMTGVRSATLDHDEIVGSLGNSSLLMEANGHRILFSIRGTTGYIEIKRSGWFGFSYSCNIGGENQVEITQQISKTQGQEIYDVKILEHVSAMDGYSEDAIVWYCIETTRVADGLTNTVHRRFKDFAILNSDIREHFKGHHLKSSLPDLPEKKSKLSNTSLSPDLRCSPSSSLLATDHNDPVFLQQRETQLQAYLVSLVRVPHVAEMISLKTFLGLMDKVRETSMMFATATLGLTLIPCDSPGSPAVIGFVQNTELCGSLTAGDIVSKVNGSAVGTLTFDGVVRLIKHLPRPIVVHFVQTLACQDTKHSGGDKPSSSPSSVPMSSAWKGDTMTAHHSAFFQESVAAAGEEEEQPSRAKASAPVVKRAEPLDTYTSFKSSSSGSPTSTQQPARVASPPPRHSETPEYVSFG